MSEFSRRCRPHIGSIGLAVLLAAFSAAGSGAAAQSPAEIGRALAEKSCARCHAIGKTGRSPMREAPPFREFARKWPLDSLEEALAEGIVTAHPDMPEFQFDSEDIAALIAYLDEIGE
jgi:cytochrome c